MHPHLRGRNENKTKARRVQAHYPEPFLSTLQKVNFCQTSNIMLAAIFFILKNYHPMQKLMSVVIGVYKFGQEFFMIGIF